MEVKVLKVMVKHCKDNGKVVMIFKKVILIKIKMVKDVRKVVLVEDNNKEASILVMTVVNAVYKDLVIEDIIKMVHEANDNDVEMIYFDYLVEGSYSKRVVNYVEVEDLYVDVEIKNNFFIVKEDHLIVNLKNLNVFNKVVIIIKKLKILNFMINILNIYT